jgi:quinol monooxygenase YgiN
MAVALLAEIPGLTRDQYQRVVAAVNEAGTPSGALMHAAGPIDGGYRVIEVWDSQQAADAFYGSEVYAAATADLDAQPNLLMTWTVEGLDSGAGWHPLT